jgi:hypothetical protein
MYDQETAMKAQVFDTLAPPKIKGNPARPHEQIDQEITRFLIPTLDKTLQRIVNG